MYKEGKERKKQKIVVSAVEEVIKKETRPELIMTEQTGVLDPCKKIKRLCKWKTKIISGCYQHRKRGTFKRKCPEFIKKRR